MMVMIVIGDDAANTNVFSFNSTFGPCRFDWFVDRLIHWVKHVFVFVGICLLLLDGRV